MWSDEFLYGFKLALADRAQPSCALGLAALLPAGAPGPRSGQRAKGDGLIRSCWYERGPSLGEAVLVTPGPGQEPSSQRGRPNLITTYVSPIRITAFLANLCTCMAIFCNSSRWHSTATIKVARTAGPKSELNRQPDPDRARRQTLYL